MCEHETMQQLSLIAWLACAMRAEVVFVSNDLIGQRALSNGHLTHSFDWAHPCSKCGNLADFYIYMYAHCPDAMALTNERLQQVANRCSTFKLSCSAVYFNLSNQNLMRMFLYNFDSLRVK